MRVSRVTKSNVNIRFVTHMLTIPLEVPDGQNVIPVFLYHNRFWLYKQVVMSKIDAALSYFVIAKYSAVESHRGATKLMNKVALPDRRMHVDTLSYVKKKKSPRTSRYKIKFPRCKIQWRIIIQRQYANVRTFEIPRNLVTAYSLTNMPQSIRFRRIEGR